MLARAEGRSAITNQAGRVPIFLLFLVLRLLVWYSGWDFLLKKVNFDRVQPGYIGKIGEFAAIVPVWATSRALAITVIIIVLASFFESFMGIAIRLVSVDES